MFRGIRIFNSRDVFQLESPVGLIDDLFALSQRNLLHAASQNSVRRRVNLGDIPTGNPTHRLETA